RLDANPDPGGHVALRPAALLPLQLLPTGPDPVLLGPVRRQRRRLGEGPADVRAPALDRPAELRDRPGKAGRQPAPDRPAPGRRPPRAYGAAPARRRGRAPGPSGGAGQRRGRPGRRLARLPDRPVAGPHVPGSGPDRPPPRPVSVRGG